jgi:hypothetical protein
MKYISNIKEKKQIRKATHPLIYLTNFIVFFQLWHGIVVSIYCLQFYVCLGPENPLDEK